MNFFRRNIFSKIVGAAFAAASALILPSCGMINDDIPECPEGARLRFVYDYNMEFANAFPSQVDCLTLLVYDKDGNYISSYTETSDVLADENWRWDIKLPAGDYHFEAWGGMACPEATFHFTQEPAAGSKFTDLQVAMNQNAITSPQGTKLHNLFFGALDMTVEQGTTTYTEGTVYMMKDTNNIRLLLQNINGEPLDGDDFIFTIEDDNTLLNYDNSVIAGHGITYYPWTTGQVSSGVTEQGSEAKLAFAELSTSRLTLGTKPVLKIVRKSDGKALVDIPLVNYLLLLKSQEFADMESQEFLDRESRWNMVFFLENGSWMNVYIKINDWIVRINNAEM